MEIANSGLQDLVVRRANEGDLAMIAEIMQVSRYNHIHVDWRVPRHWLNNGIFLVAERPPTGRSDRFLQGCLAIGADPPPGAWVRVAAVRRQQMAVPLLNAMMASCLEELSARGVRQVAWLPRGHWPQEWMEATGFTQVDEVVTYKKDDLIVPEGAGHAEHVIIRDVRAVDMVRLVEIERAAFEPIWRHSEESLSIGWHYAMSFHVAEVDGQVVGFQYSSESDVPDGAHLVRLTVDPEAQRGGIGSALLRAALESYQERGLREASLNTQLSNVPSRRLYEKFGFRAAGYHWPVWSYSVAGSNGNVSEG